MASAVSHSHDGVSHSHVGEDHGHTHEILDGPGSYLGREMPIIEGRDWSERAFTVGIGGYVIGLEVVNCRIEALTMLQTSGLWQNRSHARTVPKSPR